MPKSVNAQRTLALLLSLLLTVGVLAGCSRKSGDGSVKAITLQVVHGDGSAKEFQIETDKGNLREALEQEGLIAGDQGEFGLFVKTVDGETVNDANQEWWCLTKGGEMWQSGVDSTEIADGDAFEFTLTVGY